MTQVERWTWVVAVFVVAAACSSEEGGGSGGAGGEGGSAGDGTGGSSGQGTGGSSGQGTGGSSGQSTGGSSGASTGGSSGQGTGGSGGDSSTATCVVNGSCDATSCARGACFDLDRCAADQVTFWGGQWHDYAQDVAVTSNDDRVIVGFTQLADEFTADRDLLVTKLSPGGTEIWSRQFGTTPGQEHGMAVKVDAADFIYVTGASEGDFEGDANAGGRDVFVLKLTPDGTIVWSTLFGSAALDTGNDIAFDAQGNVLVAGDWNNDYQAVVRQPFVARISADGAMLENTPLDIGYAEAATIDVDAGGNVFITGEIQQPGASTTGLGDVFAKKLAPDGSETWSLEWASDEDDWTNGAALDQNGQLYVIGTTAGGIEGNPAPSTGNWSMFLSLIDASGTLSWTRTYHPDVDTRGGDVVVGENGDVLVVGSALGELMLEGDTLGVNAFTMRLCTDGSPITLQQWDLGSDDWSYALTEAHDGTIVLAGYSFQRITMGAEFDSEQVFLIEIRPE